MRKLFILLLLSIIPSFALTLEQVRAELANSAISSDSIEMSIRTTVNTPAGVQTVSVYIVQKGLSKIYTEMHMPLMNQRSIVNGARMKVVDLNTNKFQIMPYNGDALAAMAYADFNLLKSGEWNEPKFVSDGVYSQTTFDYDAENNLKKMTVSVVAQGVKTSVVTEILAMRSSAKFPDKVFEF